MKYLFETIGWCGALLIVIAYGLLSFSFLSSTSVVYQSINAVGALGIVINSLSKKDYPPTALNVIWFCVALIAIIRLL